MDKNDNIDQKRNEASETLTIDEILESFKIFDGVYKREQIDAAISLKDEITPHLINVLENVLADPEQYTENTDLYDQIYTLMLLGHFKEAKAHNVIVDLFSLPGDLPDQIFGDIVTSNLPAILLHTCDGSVGLIKSLILNREANDFCRGSACNALAYAVFKGYVSRESVIEFFGKLFTGEEADEMSDFWGLLSTTIYSLYPEEMMDVIKQAYDDDLIDPRMIHYDDFEKVLELGKDECLGRLKSDMERDCSDDIHATMSWWSCFNEEEEPFSSLPWNAKASLSGYSKRASGQSRKNKKKAKKKKRKQAKASKKKNRR